MDTLAASTVIGAFAFMTAKNALKKHDLEKSDADTVTSLSSLSMTSAEDCLVNQPANLKYLSRVLGKKTLSSLELMSQIGLINSKYVFDMKGFCPSAENVISISRSESIASIVLGTASSYGVTTIITSTDLIDREINRINLLKNVKGSSIWHIGCQKVDQLTLEQFTDFSAVLNLKLPTLVATTLRDLQEHALLAQLVGSLTSTSIVSCVDGVSAENQKHSAILDIKSYPVLDTKDSLLTNLSIASKHLFNKDFLPVDYYGSLDADVLIISFGSPAQAFGNVIENIPEVGLLTVKFLNPLVTDMLLDSIPKSSQRICVVDYSPDNTRVLYDLLAPILIELSNDIQIFSTLINSKKIKDIDSCAANHVISNALSVRVNRNLRVGDEQTDSLEIRKSIYSNSSSVGSVLNFSSKGSVLDSPLNKLSLWSTATDTKLKLSFKNFFHQITETEDISQGIIRQDIKFTKDKKEFERFTQFGLSTVELSLGFVGSRSLLFAVDHLNYGGTLILLGKSKNLNVSDIDEVSRDNIFNKNIEVRYLQLTNVTTILDVINRINNTQKLNLYEFKVTKIIQTKDVDFVSRKRGRPDSLNDSRLYHGQDSSSSFQKTWPFLFNESYQARQVLRPSEHGVGTAVVTKFERLTPASYSRNIFHIEFDISGTGFKYEIGDALGVFGENDTKKVDQFIEAYGLDSEQLVHLPARGIMKDTETELVSVRNLLIKNLDIFGKVSKRFYLDLAKFATSRYEKLKLLHTGTDDAEQFKLGGYETVTPAELLLQYKSCKLSIEDIIKIVPDIKPRHYSISSSMKMSPTSVHLLVVAVDWVTPKGKRGEGQCTRFLKSLSVGQKVSVDIQKSVLRLPPKPEQPIIMAGLGTGMAPFRAFIQQRYFMKMLGYNIGPMILYFGARHKAQEWLYGEELEKYERLGLLRLGLAWSRDQEHKVYIQDKIRQDKALLKKYLKDQNGYFYLCGPTWPVPDVRDAINNSLQDNNGVEQLKEEGRYILEVY